MTIRRRRLLLLVLGLPVYLFVLIVVGAITLGGLVSEERALANLPELVAEVFSAFSDDGFLAWFGIPAAVITALQGVFLIPVIDRRPPKGTRSRPLAVSLFLVAGVAAALVAGLGFAALELVEYLTGAIFDGSMDWVWGLPVLALVVSWAGWTLLLLMYVRGVWADRVLGRLVAVLFAGSIIEMLLVVPLDVMVRRRTDCYCSEGTFFALALSATAMLALTGPGIFIATRTRHFRQLRRRHCGRCAYPKGPTPAERCPECGYEWRRDGVDRKEVKTGPNDPGERAQER